MSKHTPGPWGIASDPDGISSPRVIAPGLNDVCVICGAASNESVMADARLIAAAPDLLAFVEEFLDAWEDGMASDSFMRRKAERLLKLVTGGSDD